MKNQCNQNIITIIYQIIICIGYGDNNRFEWSYYGIDSKSSCVQKWCRRHLLGNSNPDQIDKIKRRFFFLN